MDSQKDLTPDLQLHLNCRICLDQESEINRFHNFCVCSKTMPTHLRCLQMWLKKNATINETNGIKFYNFLDSKCDICQQQFPSTYQNMKGEVNPLILPDVPQNSNYCLLEIYKIQDPKIIKALMIIDMSKTRKLSIGRGDSCDIRFKHHSISREHGVFILDNDFRLMDNGSKYGTFVALEKEAIKKKENKILLMDNFLLEIHPFRSKPCQCIKHKDHSELQINPFQSDKAFLKNKSKNFSKKMKEDYKKEVVCSLEEIQEQNEDI